MPEYTEEQNKIWAEVQKISEEKKQLEEQLEGLYITETHDRQLPPGRTDVKVSEELTYTTKTCTNPSLAAELQKKIEMMEVQIKGMADKWNEIQNNTIYNEKQNQMNKAMNQELENAKELALHRYSKMSKLKKAYATITGQKSKFEKLIKKAATLSPEEKKATIEQIDQFYRGK